MHAPLLVGSKPHVSFLLEIYLPQSIYPFIIAHNAIFNRSEVIAACKVVTGAASENPLAKVFAVENLLHTGPSSTRYLGLWCMANGRYT